ncbi:MAG: hypothetical protein UDR59_11000 [Christensenellales bacterium]|nr:hypothetical protein [Christensenellales bacterium]
MKKKSFAILLAAALLLCLLPGMAPEAKAETIRDKCRFCNTTADHEITRFERFNDDYHYVIYICSHCGKGSYALFDDNPIGRHSGGTETPTCTTGKTCTRCGTQYGKLGHDWGAWQSRGNNSEHFRTCQRDGCDAVDTESCSGDSIATCITLGTCTTCGGQYYSAHTFPANQGWDSDAENHWVSCTVCHEAKTKVGAHFFVQGNDSSCLKSAATCVSPPVYYTNCAYCYRKGTDTYVHPWYGPDPNNHDLVHHDAKAPTCTEIGWDEYDACQREGCTYTTKVEIPALKHKLVHHDAKAPSCTEIGWEEYDTCSRCDYTTKVELLALKHNLVHHDAKAPTCTEIGWDEYDTCSRCDYTTKVELLALKHDLVHHDAKAPTCTEIGWNEYDTCSRCDYTTKVELPALKHKLVHHDAKAPTCTEIGWDEYDTCSRCDYTTKVEIPAPGHDYTEKVVKPTCEKVGYTLHTCKNCNDSYKDHQTKTLLHWYGEWTSNGDGTHSATCKRKDCKHVSKTECAIVEFKQDEATRTLCPVCGNVSDGTHLALVEEVTAEGEHLPYGEPVLRMGETANGNTLLSVCFEVSGKLTRPKGEVKITMPAELLNGVTLALLNADGTEIDLPYIVEGENAVFTLDFTDAEIPTMLIRLIPTAE